jgi:hypothetical protein
LAHRGVLRWLAFALPSPPVVVIVVYAMAGPSASPREYAAGPSAGLCDHESEIGWREGREVWIVRQGHQARC